MKALVVVESVFGNTRQIAEAIAQGLGDEALVRVVDVADAPATVDGVDLLVVGGPTHAFGMTRESTRRAAAEQSGGAVPPAAVGLREWLAVVRVGPVAGAAFDTRMDTFRLPGSAAKGAARALRRLGVRLVDRPRTFRVVGMQGPLRDGEPFRARAWGAHLAAQMAPVRPGAGA
ncbi:Flavodoxin [Pseudonocardia thermophila]|jgi:Flavodoxins|uniref:Flavodoxin n=1 Tax=Pseudonocardia thermophila TaxID=1848 RepID=A0A1M6V105_PSETH|nr:flavodoxin domain-containing protein [Pseudonocardia thermophila]SHK75084.1 Flavodoxin [Pseudonocardia thermophila]